MIVTDIVEYTKAKYKIFIDGEFAFVLYKGELRQFNIRKGEELDEDAHSKILEEILPKRAKLRAMHLLEKRPYTEKVLRDKLKESFYGEEVIDQAIDYLKGYKYIDDYSYACQYLYTYSGTKTVKKMEQDLMIKGIKKDTIREAIESCKDAGELVDEKAMIRDLLRKKNYSAKESTPKDRNKIMNYLYNKGFSIDNIRREMNFDEDF